MRLPMLPALPLLLVALHASTAFAAWPNSSYANLPLCTQSGYQSIPTVLADGAGGAYVGWEDQRTGTTDIYVQHVLATGIVDPAWPVDGLAVCTAPSYQFNTALVSDGAGGVIVGWQDLRSGSNYDVYAHHVLPAGSVDPAWPVNGRAVSTATNHQEFPVLVSDGAGGAIFAWHDSRSGAYDIYAHHLLASGTMDPAWPLDGVALCTAPNSQTYPAVVSDGAGGAVLTWVDQRAASADIYAHHVQASGVPDPAWPADGRAVCTAVNDQSVAAVVSDGAGGAIISWRDNRSGVGFDIYAHHVTASGAMDPTWPANGRAICTAAGGQGNPVIATDGANGAIVAWDDFRGASWDIYAQRVLASGTVAWAPDGIAVSTASLNQLQPEIVSDGAGGAIVAWLDSRSTVAYDLFAQRVLGTGAVDPNWTANGRPIATAVNDQNYPAIASDGAGGAILAWQDWRPGPENDVYAQRVARTGHLGSPEAEIVSVADVPNDQGGLVKVSWNASYLEPEPWNLVIYYKVFRSVPPNVAASMLARGARVVEASSFESEPEDESGTLFTTEVAGTTYYWEYLATVNTDYLSNYSYVAPTGADSSSAGAPETAFMIQARTAGSQHWESVPMTGYSVDNLAPSAPAPFTGQYGGGTTYLHWGPNAEADLAGYRLYRGTDASFVPDAGNLVAALSDTGHADPGGMPYFYKLTAVDVHGNESPVALLSPSGTLAVGEGVTQELSFAAPWPNPADANVSLRFTLPRAARVRLAVYDPMGRLVRELVNGTTDAGAHEAGWDLRDASGRRIGAGLYFARFEAEGRSILRRIVAAR